MNTDDQLNSSTKSSPAAKSIDESEDHHIAPSSSIDESPEIFDIDESLPVEKENNEAHGLESIRNDLNDKNLLESASLFFKNAYINIPNEDIPNFEKNRAFILQMATFFQTGNLSDTLLVLLIIQNSALDLDQLVNAILNTANSCPEHHVQKVDIQERIGRLADWKYYGVEGALENEQHLRLFRWDIRSLDSDGVYLDDNVKEIILNLQRKRDHFKSELNAFYAKLKDEDKTNIRKRKGIINETPAKRQKPNGALSTGKKKSQKLSVAEKLQKEQEKINRLKEKEAERKKKEEERVKKEEEKAKKLEEKQRLQMEKEAVKLKILEEKTRKQQEKDVEKKLKEDMKAAKEAERQKKEQKEIKGQKKLSGFFKPIQKKAEVVPVQNKLSDFNQYFHPFTPKSTAIVAPINRFDHHIDLESFDQSFLVEDIDVQNLFKEFCGKRKNLTKGVCRTPKAIESIIQPYSWRYLKFAEDVRPPYHGTWTKKSNIISGQRPFNQDTNIFDYEVDSEAEWEEDEPGEELVSEDEEVDAKDEEDEDQEDGWLVPHGYLSDDEGDAQEQDVDEPMRGKAKSLQPKVIQMLVPIICPPSYNYEGIPPELKVEVLYAMKNPFQVDSSVSDAKKKSSGFKKSTFPADLTGDLMKFIVKNEFSPLPKLIEGFINNYLNRNLTKVSVEAEIKKIAVKGKKGNDNKIRWYPKPGLLTEMHTCSN